MIWRGVRLCLQEQDWEQKTRRNQRADTSGLLYRPRVIRRISEQPCPTNPASLPPCPPVAAVAVAVSPSASLRCPRTGRYPQKIPRCPAPTLSHILLKTPTRRSLKTAEVFLVKWWKTPSTRHSPVLKLLKVHGPLAHTA